MSEASFLVEDARSSQKRASSLEGIAYHLAKILPKGASVCVLFPKSILEAVLPRVAKERKLSVSVVGSAGALRSALEKQGSLQVGPNVPIDVFLAEPAAFGEHGAWVHPSESYAFGNEDVIAVASVHQWSAQVRKEEDLVKIKSVVSEKGVLLPEIFAQEMKSTLL